MSRTPNGSQKERPDGESERIIPTRLEELSPSWLTQALGAYLDLGGRRVVGARIQRLGEGEGFMGEIARVALEYQPALPTDAPEHTLDGTLPPSSLIAKLPTPIRQNRGMGELLGAYEREILVYQELAPKFPLRTPQVYYADMDASTTSKYEASGAQMMDRMPAFLMKPMMNFASWIAGRRNRRYVLLIEELTQGHIGDQLKGCPVDAARAVILDIARVHAQHWESPALAEAFWLRRSDLNPRTLNMIFRRGVAGYRALYKVDPSTRLAELLDWIQPHGADVLRRLAQSAPDTLQHGDLRLDNIYFLEAEGPSPTPEITLFDWQLAGRGPGAYDIAYFLSGALDSEQPRSVALELLDDYHRELVNRGVSGYTREACQLDFDRALPVILQRLASTDAMDMGDDRGIELIRLWSKRLIARLDGVELASLIR